MKELCATSPFPIALDEELIEVNETERKIQLLDTIRPQYIILKPSLHGGIQGSKEWITLAQERGIGYWVTSALESNIGLNAIAQWCATLNLKCLRAGHRYAFHRQHWLPAAHWRRLSMVPSWRKDTRFPDLSANHLTWTPLHLLQNSPSVHLIDGKCYHRSGNPNTWRRITKPAAKTIPCGIWSRQLSGLTCRFLSRMVWRQHHRTGYLRLYRNAQTAPGRETAHDAKCHADCQFLRSETRRHRLALHAPEIHCRKMVVVRALVAGLNLLPVTPCGHPLAEINTAPEFAAMIPMQVYNSLISTSRKGMPANKYVISLSAAEQLTAH